MCSSIHWASWWPVAQRYPTHPYYQDGVVLIHRIDDDFKATLVQELAFNFSVWRVSWSAVVGN